MLPLYEGKMGWQYDHRAATFMGVGDTDIVDNHDHGRDALVVPRYWIRESVVEDRLARREWGTRSALLGFRRVARNTDERTSIAVLFPLGAASYGWIVSAGPNARDLCLLLAQYNSFAFDYVLRQFLSQPSIPQGTFEQLPALTRGQFSTFDVVLGDTTKWIVDRVLALSTTGDEVASLAAELGRVPSVWDVDTRTVLRAELDALMFHLFGLSRDEADHVLDTFPIVRGHDEKEHGEFCTKRMILEIYEAMAEAFRTGEGYQTRLDPPFADARVADPAHAHASPATPPSAPQPRPATERSSKHDT
jgi:hypothetical protein